MKKVYNKLIRDKIPEIIIAHNEEPKVRILKTAEYRIELKKKIMEEGRELVEAVKKPDILNELADLSELIECICREYKIDSKELKIKQKEKNKKNGSFKKKMFLVETVVGR